MLKGYQCERCVINGHQEKMSDKEHARNVRVHIGTWERRENKIWRNDLLE
jgi:hypothetical protein